MQNSIPALAQAMEKLRANMIVFAYQVLHTGKRIKTLTLDIDTDTPHIRKYDELSSQIREKQKELKALNDKKAKTFFFQPVEHVRLNSKIDGTIEEIKRLKSEKAREIGLIGVADDAGVQRAKAMLEENQKARQTEQTVQARSRINLELAAQEYRELEAKADRFDPEELMDAQLKIRPEEEKSAIAEIQQSYGNAYETDLLKNAKAEVEKQIGKAPAADKPRSVRRNLQQAQEKVKRREQERTHLASKRKTKDWER